MHGVGISSIEVDQLFGYYTYRIPDEQKLLDLESNFIILYGDNGSGKTTLLKLLFSILTNREGEGLKTYIAQTPFRRYEVRFSNGTRIRIERPDSALTGSYDVFTSPGTVPQQRFRVPTNSSGIIDDNVDLTPLYQAISELNIRCYYLPDDRRLKTSFFTEQELKNRAFEARLAEHQARWSHLRLDRDEPKYLDIGSVLQDVQQFFRREALAGTSTGETNTNNLYLDVLRQLALYDKAEIDSFQMLQNRIGELAIETRDYVRFGLIPKFPADAFNDALDKLGPNQRDTIAPVLLPYLNGLRARLDALSRTKDVINQFTGLLNSFFHDKQISYELSSGITFQNRLGDTIDANALSSGEKQLTLLLSHALLARSQNALFLVDEPELSLNVKWQRRLISALGTFASGSGMQYVLATHSIELLAKNQGDTHRLNDRSGA